MPDVDASRLKVQGPCEGRTDACTADGCPKHGTLGKPGRDGARRVRACGDPVARGRRSRTKGDSKARVIRRRLGLQGARTRHEEAWGGPVRTEAKAGGKARPVRTAYEACRAQSEAARPFDDHRPFVASFAPDGTGHTYTVIRDDDLEGVVFALAAAWGFGGVA